MEENNPNIYLPICHNPRIVIFPRGERGRNCTRKLLDINCQIVGIILANLLTNDDEKFYNSLDLNKHQLPINENISEPILLEFLLKVKPDIIILAGFSRFLPISIISIAKIVVINLHAGKLPEFRGTSVVQWQIIKGETHVGCAIHVVDKNIDTGPILTQFFYPIEINTTSADIICRNREIFPIILAEVIEKISKGTALLLYQDESKAVYYSKLLPEDALIVWHRMNSLEVHNLVRAFNLQNQNGAFTYHNKRKIIIHKTSLLEQTIVGIPGRVLLKHPKGMIVMCRDKAILVCKSDTALKLGQTLGSK